MSDERHVPRRWEEIERLYHGALARHVDQRAAFLTDACADDEVSRQEIELLLRYVGFARGP